MCVCVRACVRVCVLVHMGAFFFSFRKLMPFNFIIIWNSLNAFENFIISYELRIKIFQIFWCSPLIRSAVTIP
jgi:hypothetical protein